MDLCQKCIYRFGKIASVFDKKAPVFYVYSMTDDDNRQKAIEAAVLLNEFVGDLKAAVRIYSHYKNKRGESNIHELLFIRRMCLSYLIITLAKLVEVYKRYKAILSDNSIKMTYKKIIKKLEKLKVIDATSQFK